ncbi:MAG: hypothetical protein JXQ90_21870 [Cyclobacteriaceae bacterium]
MNKSKQIGLLLTLVGAFCIYWAYSHSPKAGIGKIVGNELSGSYTMSETSYYISLAIGAVIAIYGVMKFVKGK